MERLLEIHVDWKMGLEGEVLQKFVMEQQAIEQEERHCKREMKRVEMEAEAGAPESGAKQREASRQHKLEMRRLELESVESSRLNSASYLVHLNEQVSFQSYLLSRMGKTSWIATCNALRGFTRSNGWNKKEWATALSALLTGLTQAVRSN